MILGISIAFLLLSAVVLWFVIGAKGKVLTKVIAIILTCGFSISVYNGLESFRGWPTYDDVPDKFSIKWVIINEPKSKTEEGNIFLWIDKVPEYAKKQIGEFENKEKLDPKKLLYYNGVDGHPRAYRLPYSKEMHKMMQRVKAALKQGFPVVVQKKGNKSGSAAASGGKNGKDGKNGKGGKDGKNGKQGAENGLGSFNFSEIESWEFHKLPPPVLPKKF